jgi:hypothetical protein
MPLSESKHSSGSGGSSEHSNSTDSSVPSIIVEPEPLQELAHDNLVPLFPDTLTKQDPVPEHWNKRLPLSA